jgi:hypothetical protein
MNVYVLYSVAYESRTLKLDCCTTETCKLFLLHWCVYGYILLMFCTLLFCLCVSFSPYDHAGSVFAATRHTVVAAYVLVLVDAGQNLPCDDITLITQSATVGVCDVL